MHKKQANPYLDYLLTPEGGSLLRNEAHRPKHRPINPVLHHPVIGDYQEFAWKVGFDPTKDIVVISDCYSENKRIIYHSHDFFEIVYVYAGHCQTLVSDNLTRLSAGDICLYNLQAVHKMEFEASGDTVFNLAIRKDLFRRLVLELLTESDAISSFFINTIYNQTGKDTCIHLKPDDSYQCVSLFQQIIETYGRDRPSSQNVLKAQVMMLLLEIARQHRDVQARSAVLGRLRIEDVIGYINANYQSATLETTADHFGYSTRSMTRFLQKYTGNSFREVIRDVRFSRARAMLQETDLTIEEISGNLGYKDRSNFENAFKKHFHMTPAAYRKQFYLA